MPRRLGAIAALIVLVVLAGSARATTRVSDPIVGTWKITRGGSGTVTIAERAGVLAIGAVGSVTLGCVTGTTDDVVGYIDLPSKTALPAGHYNSSFGVSGQGCNYNVNLTLARGTLTGDVTFSENDQPGGPFTFVKTGSTSYSWSVKTKSINGRGRVTVDPQGAVTAASGTLATAAWKLSTVRPAKLVVSSRAFTLTVAVKVTSGKCDDKSGTLVLSAGRARLVSVCGRALSETGTVKLG